jgi:hypothetical protein
MKAHGVVRRRGFHISRRLTDGGEVSPRAGRPLPPGRFLVLISVRGWVDHRAIVRLEGLGQLKNPMTSSGIEPAMSDFESRYGQEFPFSTLSSPALGPTQSPFQWVPGALFLGVKRPGREADHSPTSAEVKKTWIYTSTPPYTFMA